MSELVNLRVVKVGGSLLFSSGLEQQGLGQRIRKWLDQQPSVPTVWVVGGGRLVDVVREWQVIQTTLATSDEDAHWMSVDLMSVTAKMFSSLTDSWQIDSSVESLQNHIGGGARNVIFDCRSWLQTVDDLPCSWSVTSDSIAGRLAIELSCRELVLLKSRAAAGPSVEQNVAHGVIDEHFAALELQCGVTVVNLNGETSESSRLIV